MDELLWVQSVSEKIKKKLRVTAERNRDKLPFTTIDGVFDDRSDRIGWWTNGFWGGIMWQLYKATEQPLYREIAESVEEKLDQSLLHILGLDHDNGFKWLPTAVANYRLTGNERARERGLITAGNLAGRFNPIGKFIRAWNDNGDGCNAGLAIIDCMMNLPLLYWASEEFHDPRFRQIAKMHADTTAKYFVREDGSVNHQVDFDPNTGEFLCTYAGQGCDVGSSWTRGQGWALYGFTLSFLHTGDSIYLNTAKKVADYFISCIPKSGLIPIDFRQPVDCIWEDSTASALAACGLLELAKLVDDETGAEYHKQAIRLLTVLEEQRCNWDENTDHIVEKCSTMYDEAKHEYAIIYGDYYFIEAIWKLTGEELFIW